MQLTLKEWMGKISKSLQIRFNFWTVAITSAVLIGLSYALYLPSLGFFFDDWPQLYSLVVGGASGIKEFFLYDSRPFCYWPELALFKIWGTNPYFWHIANYIIHWLIALSLFFAFKEVWPKNKQELLWVVLLFSVYPLFDQQSVALIYVAPRVSLLFYFISLALMVEYAMGRKGKYLYLAFSIILNAINIFTVEYFIGLELVRPIVLFFIFQNEKKGKLLKDTLIHWLPYLGLLVMFVIWRLLIVENFRALSLSLLSNLMKTPLSTLGTLLEYVIKDSMSIIVTVWFPTFDASLIDFKSPVNIATLGLIALVFFVLMVINLRNKRSFQNQEALNLNATKQQVIVGFLGVIFSCIPFWLIMRSYSESVSVYVDRFGFPAMWAAAMFIVAVTSYLFSNNLYRRNLILIVFTALAVGKNFQDVNEYKWSTTWQHRILSQLKWRAPMVEKDTLFLTDIELFSNMGVYPTAFALNLLYNKDQDPASLDYYYLTLSKYFSKDINDLDAGIPVDQKRWYTKFQGNTAHSIVMQWPRSADQCLWVLSPYDEYNPLIPTNTRLALSASDLDRIQTNQDSLWPDKNLFGNGDANSWCYFYQTADLARQQGDWEKITLLYETAKQGGYSPANGVELIPFIEGYARSGSADIALDLTFVAKSITPNMRNYLCDTWNRLSKDIDGDLLFDSEYRTYSEMDLCWEVE